MPAGTLGPARLQVLRHGFARFPEQGQRLAPTGPAADRHRPVLPVEVVQRESGPFASPQAQPHEQQQNGPVAPPDGGVGAAAVKQGLDLLRGRVLRQVGQAPLRDRKDAAGEVLGCVPALVQAAQEAAQGRDDQLASGLAETPGFVDNEAIRIRDSQAPQIDRAVAEAVPEVGADDGQVVDGCRRPQAPLKQEVLVLSCDAVDG